MLLKIICAVALASCLAWLYFDRSNQPVIGVCISSVALIYSLFSKKSETDASGPSFNIKSGKNSINNQSTGSIHQTIKKDA